MTAGIDTANFRIEAEQCTYFAKVYRSSADLAAEAAALRSGLRARSYGVPVPDIMRTSGGELLAKLNGGLYGGLSLHEWIDGASPDTLSQAHASSAARVLARIHDALGQSDQPRNLRDRGAAWIATDVAERRRILGFMLEQTRMRDADPFCQTAVGQIERRLSQLDRVAGLMQRFRGLQRQLIHGDFSRLNILFGADERVSGVVDFRPPFVYFPTWELARVALDPDTACLADDWKETAYTAIRAYWETRESKPTVVDLSLTPALWASHLVLSTYGLRQHLFDPHPREQNLLDRYWSFRCGAATRILDSLDELETEIGHSLVA